MHKNLKKFFRKPSFLKKASSGLSGVDHFIWINLEPLGLAVAQRLQKPRDNANQECH